MITAKYNPKEPVDSIFVYKKLWYMEDFPPFLLWK
jgi:hypothetical protein